MALAITQLSVNIDILLAGSENITGSKDLQPIIAHKLKLENYISRLKRFWGVAIFTQPAIKERIFRYYGTLDTIASLLRRRITETMLFSRKAGNREKLKEMLVGIRHYQAELAAIVKLFPIFDKFLTSAFIEQEWVEWAKKNAIPVLSRKIDEALLELVASPIAPFYQHRLNYA